MEEGAATIGALGTTLSVFIGVTVILAGFASYMTGQALANTWKPGWQVVVYGCLLGFADRFLTFALFGGELLSVSGYVIDTGVLLLIGLFSFRFNQVRKMTAQYPWMYERAGLFAWREKGG
ncbi:MAG: hypothetical protein H6907_17325 [Hyphomicrobiales bacterium]|nr:hypothetical protein [Hyphomicrobiales bacterium]MCP5373493.1 hypothetical protein [Hyphomicrobiales bacterium]